MTADIPGSDTRNGRRRPPWPAALVVLGAVLILVGVVARPAPQSPPQPVKESVAAPELIDEALPPVRVWRRPEKIAAPVRVEIPRIDVSARLVRLGLNDDRSMEVPTDFDAAGWYIHGPRPGEIGPAVIAGHVDSTSGPAVFFKLGSLRPGAVIRVRRADHSTAHFTVEAVERASKDTFPTRRVFGPTRRPALRLITCGGAFDEATGHYEDNTIVYAVER
jgi:sortase (surface protein transpeptidase)